MVNKTAIKDFTKFSLADAGFYRPDVDSAVLADSEFNHSRFSHVVVAACFWPDCGRDRVITSMSAQPVKFERN